VQKSVKTVLGVLAVCAAVGVTAPTARAAPATTFYELVNSATGKCLIVAPNRSVGNRTCTGASSGGWRFELKTGLLRNEATGMCLDNFSKFGRLDEVQISGCSQVDPGQIWDVPMTKNGDVGQIRSLYNTTKRVLVGWNLGSVNVVPPNAAGITKVEWKLVAFGADSGGGGNNPGQPGQPNH
jgi:hypothetical protein